VTASADDSVAYEEFLLELLERGFHVVNILHEGQPMSRTDFDRMIKNACGLLA
jgi:hypothetical protein